MRRCGTCRDYVFGLVFDFFKIKYLREGRIVYSPLRPHHRSSHRPYQHPPPRPTPAQTTTSPHPCTTSEHLHRRPIRPISEPRSDMRRQSFRARSDHSIAPASRQTHFISTHRYHPARRQRLRSNDILSLAVCGYCFRAYGDGGRSREAQGRRGQDLGAAGVGCG